MKKPLKIFITSLIILLLFTSCGVKNTSNVAKIEDTKLKEEVFLDYIDSEEKFNRHLFHSYSIDDDTERNQAISEGIVVISDQGLLQESIDMENNDEYQTYKSKFSITAGNANPTIPHDVYISLNYAFEIYKDNELDLKKRYPIHYELIKGIENISKN